MEMVLASAQFSRSPRLRQLLTWLVHQMEQGRHEWLNEYDVARSLKGRTDHDPVAQSDIRKSLSRLRSKLEEFYRTSGASRPYQIRLPGGFLPRLVAAPNSPCDLPLHEKLASSAPILLHFEGMQISREANVDLAGSLEAEMLFIAGSNPRLRICTRDQGGADGTLRGRIWGKDPVFALFQLLERQTGLIVKQARFQLSERPDHVAVEVLRQLGLHATG